MNRIRIAERTLSSDLQTPIGIYLKVRDMYPQSSLLESSDYHTVQNSFSYIGVNPIAKFFLRGNIVTCEYPSGIVEEVLLDVGLSVIEEFKKYIMNFDVEKSSIPNGFFGYTSYDCVRYFENIGVKNGLKDYDTVPDMMYILYRYIIEINHFKNQLTVLENISGEEESEIDSFIETLSNNNIAQYNFSSSEEIGSSISDDEFRAMVDLGIKHVKRGDVFQIVLSRLFHTSFSGDDFNLYRALRTVNPSPYLFYFDLGDFRIFGSSPETHIRIKGNKAFIDPIAGTFKRTGDDERDMKLAEKLLSDKKENSEHVMLVDLARNDLGRVCDNVKIEFFRQIQYYSHVIHMVSRVSGELEGGSDNLDLFSYSFPAGTLSGAPKVRAMQLINEIEKHNRCVYGGCIGFIGFNFDLNQAITIRSFLSINNKLYFQAGAGVVADSNPDSELQEVNNKLGALKIALERATKI